MAFCVYIRYKQIQRLTIDEPEDGISKVPNIISAIFGFSSCIGLTVLANIPESKFALAHMTGAVICFTSANIYFLMQVRIFITN